MQRSHGAFGIALLAGGLLQDARAPEIFVVRPPVAVRPDFEFETLPASIDGERLGWPVAIASDGTVLFTKDGLRTAGLYRDGRLETIELGDAPTGRSLFLRDVNVRHEIVGYWDTGGYFPVPANGLGFVRDREGPTAGSMSVFPFVALQGINDAGVAAGSLVTSSLVGDGCAWFCYYEYHAQPVLVMDGEVH